LPACALDARGAPHYQVGRNRSRALSPAVANRRGIIAMLASMSLFTANDTLVKIASSDLPPGQIMAVRGVFAVVLVMALVVGRGEARQLRELRQPLVLVRGALEATLAFLFITSLSRLPIVNVNAILLATPIILTALSVALGLERVGWRRWSAVLVGFLGVLLIVKPSLSGMNPYAGLALGCAVVVAVRDLLTRRIGSAVPTEVITLGTIAAVTLGGFALSFGEAWRTPSAHEVALLATAAIFVGLGNMAIIRALRIGEISVVSPFRYSIVLTTLFVGYAVFGEWPDLLACFGIVLVVASGLYTFRREQIGRKHAVRDHPRVALAGKVP